jgi:metallo-beta-lactamase class B
MPIFRIMTAALLGLGLLVSPALADAPFAKSRAMWNRPVRTFRVIDNIYYVGVYNLSSFLIVTPKGNILLDATLPESAGLVESNIRKLGFKVEDIKILINSHAHFDHFGGMAQIKRDSGAVFYASAADKPILESGHIAFGPAALVDAPPVKVDHVVDDGGTVSLGGVTLTAHLTPGHTPGCTSWSMPVTENGVTHQALFWCSMQVGGNPLVNNKAYPRIVEDFKASFAKAKTLNPDVLLANHANQFNLYDKMARMVDGAPNPFIDAEEYHPFLLDVEKQFEKELAHQQAGNPPTPLN